MSAMSEESKGARTSAVRGWVWVIEQGSYSDYRVVGVYSSAKNAQLVADRLNAGERYGDDATVAKWPLDPAIAEINAGLSQWLVTMAYDGTVEQVRPTTSSSYDLGGDLGVWQRTKAPAWKGQPISDAIHGTTWATDEQHAVKIANERRIQEIASGKMKTRPAPTNAKVNP